MRNNRYVPIKYKRTTNQCTVNNADFKTLKKNDFANVRRGTCLSEFCILVTNIDCKWTCVMKQLEMVSFVYAVV